MIIVYFDGWGEFWVENEKDWCIGVYNLYDFFVLLFVKVECFDGSIGIGFV